MKVKLARIISMVVLAVFSLYLVPHEFVHFFYDHEDTEHMDVHSNDLSFSEVHIHCDFLSTDITDFVFTEQQNTPSSITVLEHHYASPEVQSLQVVAALRESRGPPALS